MNTVKLMQMADALKDAVRFAAETQRLVRPRDRARQLALLACLEKRLNTLRRQMLEAALTEVLWQYQDYVEGTDTGYVVRQLIADIAARQALSDER